MTRGEKRYVSVNGAWPSPASQLPKPTGAEAIAGTRLLIREAMRYYGLTAMAKKKRKFKLTSGNRYTYPNSGIWYVNPDQNGGGWHDIVHNISHYAHRRAYPNRKPHDGTHSIIEKHLIEYAVNSGWLEGKLKRTAKEKPVVDLRTKRHAGVLAKIKAWKTKQKRAATALKKLEKQRRYYERALPSG